MKKVAYLIITLAIVLIAAVFAIYYNEYISLKEAFGVLGQYLVIISAVLVFYQMKINFNFNQRKATSDFIFGAVYTILLPQELKLKMFLEKEILLFKPTETLLKTFESLTDETKKKELKETVHNILNFYERMSISILSNSYDENMCYDDKGLLMIHFLTWCETYIHFLEANFDERAFSNSMSIVDRWRDRYENHLKEIRSVNKKRQQSKIMKQGPIA